MKNKLLLFIFSCCFLSYAHRTRRALVFTKNSKLFFRLNGKDNLIPWSQVFAHGWAFRVNFDLPETIPRRHQFFKRDLHEELEIIDTLYETNPFSCMMKSLCATIYKVQSAKICGMLCNIGNIIKSSSGIDVNFFKRIFNKCSYYIDKCSGG